MEAVPKLRRMRSEAVTFFSLYLALSTSAWAAPEPTEQAARAQLAAESSVPVQVRWNAAASRPGFVQGTFALPEADRELGVRRFLARHAASFKLDQDGLELDLAQSRQGLAGTYWRFHQRIDGLPVFGGEIVALTRDGGPEAGKGPGTELRALNLAQREVGRPATPIARVDGASAFAAARVAAGLEPGQVLRSDTTLGIDPQPPSALAWRVRFDSEQPPGAWEAFVDAQDGSVRSLRNRVVYATGTGLVFDPNPVASSGDTALADANDATNAALDAQRFSVPLPNLDGSGFLRGSYADARTANANQRTQNGALTFDFDRSSDSFNEVMAYFHLDRAQARIQSLGFDDVNNRVQVAIIDFKQPDFDNSQYNPSNKEISFGRGGVDDAEDADIIVHEYGHSIQDDQVPGWGGGDEGAMGEGFGDYLAGSFNEVLSQQVNDTNCLGDWDAISYDDGNPPCLRRLDGDKHYPEFLDGEVHDDGEIWAAALFKARAELGADAMDRLVIEAHFLLSSVESFEAGVDAILSTDQTLNGGANLEVLKKHFRAQGLSRELSPPSTAPDLAASAEISVDNARGPGGNYLNFTDDTKTVTRPGAEALRLHFETINTEVDESCTRGDGGCDNIYLYDADGLLYQILFGVQADVDSVLVPGDTVKVRLVSDSSVVRSGYHIDRVDEFSSAGPIFNDGFEE